MFSLLRNRFGIPGVISVIALVFAMVGGALAANDFRGNGGEANVSAKAKKGPRGPRGPAGPAGPVGPAGQEGPQGERGATGARGEQGPAGPQGKEGPKGKDGSPWTAGGTLPVGATQTGIWGVTGNSTADPVGTLATFSFSIPLAAGLDETHVHYISSPGAPVVPPQCENDAHPGAANFENPEADSGNLCVFESGGVAATPGAISMAGGGTPGASRSGALMSVTFSNSVFGGLNGTWAVTG